MIWNDRMLFLHYPKTAGKTITRVFLENWQAPVNGIVSQGSYDDAQTLNRKALNLEIGFAHENLIKAHSILRERGRSIDEFQVIFAGIRNPYDLMVSNYFFLRAPERKNVDRPAFQRAREMSFEAFCQQIEMPRPDRFFANGSGDIPDQLEFIRFEDLNGSLKSAGEQHGFSVGGIPHINPSVRGPYSDYLTIASEAAIHDRFSFFFEAGGYPRHEF